MADHTATTTTTTTTTTRSTTISFNLNYVTSIPGILKILEIIFGLLCWALIAGSGAAYQKPYQYVMFVAVTAWLTTLITFLIYLFALHATTCSGAPWSIIEFVHNALWSLLYFIAACVNAANTGNSSQLAAACAFAFFTTITYIIHTLFSLREWRGSFPWQPAGSASGGTVNT